MLAGKVLTHAAMPCAWERVAELRFGPRISENPSHLLYLEVMGRCAASASPESSESIIL